MSNNALVIDLDGTIYDSPEIDHENKNAASQAIAEFQNISVEEAKVLLENAHSLRQTSTSRILRNMDIPDELVEKYQLALIQPEKHIKEDFEVASLLRNLRTKFKLILLTNTRRQIAIRIIQAMSLFETDFDLILAGGDFDEPKPSVDTLQKALNAFDCDPASSYTIGDRWAVDHEPGQGMGMRAIEVHGRDEFVACLKTMARSNN
jgi:FMN phosphatase YigB (HAD superfamily)